MSGVAANPTGWWDHVTDAVVLIDGDRVQAINAAAGELLGVDPAWAAGRGLFLVLRDSQLERVWRDGGETELTLGARAVVARRVPGGLVMRDVSDERRADELARELLAVVSHELRTPMTTVTSTLEALGYDDLPDEQRARLLERARAEADRVVRLLSDLTVSVDPPRERTLLLQDVFLRAEPLLATSVPGHQAKVTSSLGGLTVWADADKLLQVLLNLLENAVVHGPPGGEVAVTAVPEGDWLELQVSDLGGPLPTGVEERLFTPYSGSGRGKGRGLGLYVVRRIVERWGGRAWYSRWQDESGAGGNRFHVLVPARRPFPSSAP